MVRALAGLDVGNPSQLRRAALDGCGVLLWGLSQETAVEAAERLDEANIAVAIDSDAWLNLPTAVPVRAHALRDGALQFRDGYGEHHRLEGSELALLALAQLPAPRSAPPWGGPGSLGSEGGSVAESDERALGTALAAATGAAAEPGVLEVFAQAPPRRFQVQTDRFHFGGLRSPLVAASRGNLLQLAAELARFAPQACRLPSDMGGGGGDRGTAAIPPYASQGSFARACGAALRRHFEGDLSRYPLDALDEPASAGDLPAEAEAALLMLRGRGERRARVARPHRGRFLAAKLLLLAAALGGFLWALRHLRALPAPPL